MCVDGVTYGGAVGLRAGKPMFRTEERGYVDAGFAQGVHAVREIRQDRRRVGDDTYTPSREYVEPVGE